MTNKYTRATVQPEYHNQFWNLMQCKAADIGILSKGESGGFELPTPAANELMNAITEESVFRKIATRIPVHSVDNHILAKNTTDIATFVPAGGAIPGLDGNADFTILPVERHKLTAVIKIYTAFVLDAAFPFEHYLTERLGKNFGRAEDKGFITGTGIDEPTGILNVTGGAETALTTSTLTYDDVFRLYHSVDKSYRKNAVWLMNDETALHLRTLKDDAGNYLWNAHDNTILGKQIEISEHMPNIGAGAKPIAFGDFKYYWIVDRSAVFVKLIQELYAVTGLLAYLAYEFIDGKLIRKDAVKVIQITE